MSERLEKYICDYFQGKVSIFKRYLLAALDSPNSYIWYLDSSLGTVIPSIDVYNCELLTDARLFREDIKLSRDGHNKYKLFYLTDLGREMAQQMKEECSQGEIPEGCT